MSSADIVMINGRAYNRVTGMPVVARHPELAKSDHSARAVHQKTAKSETLSRRYVKKPDYLRENQEKAARTAGNAARPMPPITHFQTRTEKRIASVPKPTHVISDIRRSTPRVAAPAPTMVSKLEPADQPDQPAIVHPMVQRVAAARAAAAEKRVAKPAGQIKRDAITKALAAEPSNGRKRRAKDHSERDAKVLLNRRWSLVAGGVAVLLASAYFTYISIPNISVRVAAAQAGVQASYPAYRPSGYSLSGAVAYQPGSVSMNFTQNGGRDGFTLTQANSGWDSSALYQNYVAGKSGGNYNITEDDGLTIYTYGDDAAWVSGGILYTIHGNATLSNNQIQNIATSL